jgi:protein-S-isoprenylcysteine O-methyltransferase Ste14
LPGITDFIVRFAVFAAVHSLLAGRSLQQSLRLHLGIWFRGYRLSYNALSLVMFGWVMTAYREAPVLYQFPGLWRLPFYIAQAVVGIALCRCAARLGIGDFFGLAQLRGETAEPVLITDGCYRRVRHPQYTLAVLFLLLAPVMTLKWLLLAVLSAIYFVVGAHIEEKRLMAVFGAAYTNYRKQVPMFIPRLFGKDCRN